MTPSPQKKTQGAKSQTGIPGQKHYTHAAALSLGEEHALCDPPWEACTRIPPDSTCLSPS